MGEGERTLSIRLKADGSGFVGEVKIAGEQTDKLEQSFERLKGQLAVVTTLLTGYAAATAYGVKQVIDQQDAVNKLSQVYGIQVEQLSAYSHMAKLANISNEELALGLRSLIKNMDEAAAKRGDGGRIFKALGLDVNGKGLDQVLGDIADKFASFRDGPEKAALALQLFGRSGERLIPMLNQGAAGIAAVKAEAERLGITFGGEAARAAEQFNDNLTRVNDTFTAMKAVIARDAVPALNAMMERFLAARREGAGLFSSIFEGIHGFYGAGDRELAERVLGDAVSERLALQNDLLRLGGVGGSAAAAGRRNIARQISELDDKIRQAQALLKVTEPGFFGGGEEKPKGAAPRVVDLTQENQLLNQLKDTYAQLTGQVSVYDSVERKMAEGQKDFDPVLRKEIEAWARRIDVIRRNRIENADLSQRLEQQDELAKGRSEQDKARVAAQVEIYNMIKAAEIAAIQDPVVRARAAFEEEVRLRKAALTEDASNVEAFNKWRAARENQLVNEQLKPQYQKNLEAWSDTTRLMRENWEREMLAMQQAGEDAFVQFATTGKLQVADLTRTIEAELARSLYRSLVGSAAGGGGAGLLGFLGLGGGGGGSQAGLVSHAGGVIGSDSFPMRTLPASTWAGAPRLHGGLAGDEYPAILQSGETVLPRGMSGHVVNADLNLTIHAPGADAGTEARLREMVRQEIGPAFYKHRRTIAGIVENQRRESGRRAV